MSTRIPVSDLLPNTQYAVRVRAKNGDSASEWSQRVLFTTLTDAVPPSVPANSTWVVNGDSFHGEWDAVTTNTNGDAIVVTRYEVEAVGNSVTKIVSVPPVIDNKNVFDLSFAGNAALFGGIAATVTFRVRAVDNKELKSAWSTLISRNNPPPGDATGFAAVGGTGTIDLTWTPPSDNDLVGYELYIGATKIWAGDATRFTYQTVTYTSQTFTLKSVDKFNQRSTGVTATGTANSPFTVDTTAPAQPTGIAATITTANDFALTTDMAVSWSAVANPTNDLMGYQVRYKKTTASNYDYVNVDNATTAVAIRGLEPYVAYHVSVQAYDFTRNYSGFPANVTATAATNANPSQPFVPTVSANTMQIQVTATGLKNGGGAIEADVAYYEVYASITNGFTPAVGNMLGQIAVGPAMTQVFTVPTTGGLSTQTWYVVIIAVDKGGLKSSASPQATSTPGLIANTNIVDATITSAKIHDLNADLITAGSGLIANLDIKSTLTIGTAASSGTLQSYEYLNTSGVSGWQFTKNGLVIKSGSISAQALLLQTGSNLLPPEYADFEYNNLFYISDYVVNVALQGVANAPADVKFNSQCGYQTWTAVAGVSEKWFGKSATDYNVAVDQNTTYIVSGYFRKNGGTVQGFTFKFKDNLGNIYTPTMSASTVTNTATGSWVRVWGYFTTNNTSGINKGILYQSVDRSVAGDLQFDGLQMETKIGNINTPSAWSPPGSTALNGYGIRTGSIISSTFAQVWDTSLNSGLGGYKSDTNQPAWSINTAGAAQFGDANVRGSLIVGPTNTTGNAVGTVTTTNQSFMASSTYSPTAAGWILRADGTAEFRSVAVGSFNGSAIAKNTLAADSIIGGTINAVVAIGSTLETTQQQDSMKATWSSGGTTLTPATSYFFYAEDIGALVSGTNIAAGTTITAYNATTGVVTISAATTGAGSSSDIIVYRGRRVRINGTDGITLTNSLGVVQIQLPTKAGVDAKFTGTITTNNINVKDNFSMLGTHNSIAQGGLLNLADANYVPSSAPQFTFDWTSQHLTDGFGNNYAPNADSFVNTPLGWVYDASGASTQKYWYFFDFFGPNAQAYDTNLAKAYQTSAITTTFGSKVVYGGASLDHANSMFYYLTYDKGTTNWSVYSISRTNVAAGMTTLTSGPTTWNKNLDGLGCTGFASIGARAGAIYIAKVNNSGNLKIEKYASITAVGTGTTTAVGNFPYYGTGSSVISVNVGQFDYGTGQTYIIVTVLLGSGFMYNWVFQDNGGTIADTGAHFPIPYNKSPIGITYVGTNNDDANGYFATLSSDGYVYKHTQLGKSNTSATVNANQRWRSDATGGSYSPAAFGPNTGPDTGSITYQRRSRMTVSSIIDVPSVALGPNAVSFYVGHDGGSKFLQYDPDNGTSQSVAGKSYIRLAAFQDSNATTGIPAGTLPTGTAGKITSTNGMYIQGDGHAHFPGTGWQVVGVTGGAATFNSGWGNFASATYGFARYRRVGTRVDVEGLVTRSSGGTVPFTLPSGYRPATGQLRIYSTNISGVAGRMDVYPETGTGAGGIDFPGYAATGGFLSINVSFYTD